MHQPLQNSHENLKIFLSLRDHQEKYTAYNQQTEMGFGLDHYQSYTQVCKEKKRKHDESQNLVNNQVVTLPLDPEVNQAPLGSVASRMDEGMSVNQSSENSESFEYYDPGLGASADPNDENNPISFHDDDDEDDEDDEGDETSRLSSESSNQKDIDDQSLQNDSSDECCMDSPPPVFPSEFDSVSNPKKPGKVSMADSCSFELMRLFDEAGSPRYLYDNVRILIKEQEKNGFNHSNLKTRDSQYKFVLNRYENYPEIQSKSVSGHRVYRFEFIAMLQDLLDKIGDDIHIIKREEVLSETRTKRKERNFETRSELWFSEWMEETFKNCDTYKDFDWRKEIMLPLILYVDKTGTDALQRYSLEPLIFAIAALRRERRESGTMWGHLGLIPSSLSEKTDDRREGEDQGDTELQKYHDNLGYLLEGLIAAQKDPPLVTVKRNGVNVQLRARVPIMIVMGDQKSQDTLCGRKAANSGGAARVHRSCMCSYINVDDPHHKCVEICSDTINRLTKSALMSTQRITEIASNHIANQRTKGNKEEKKSVIEKYLKKQQRMNLRILQYPFTQHALRNAFEEVDFGAWKSGIYKATFDDFMHSTESGIFEYIGELVYGGLTTKENSDVEKSVRRIFHFTRCSNKSTFPRWRINKNFTNQSLMTCAEKVGGVLVLALSLQYTDVFSIIQKGHTRQQKKYVTFSSETREENKTPKKPSAPPPPQPHHPTKKMKTTKNKVTAKPPLTEKQIEEKRNKEAMSRTPFFWTKYMSSKLTLEEVEIRLETMARHGFDVNLLKTMDLFQIHSLISHCDMGSDIQYPKNNIPGHYTKLGDKYQIRKKILDKVQHAFSSSWNPSKILEPTRFIPIAGTIPKHYRQKPKTKGVGGTSAILVENIKSFVYYLEYLLCFHAFCRYSYSLPSKLQDQDQVIDFGSRTVVQYFEKMVYRGDDSVDSRTTKIHANKRVGKNHKCLGTCMHADCQTGERLLKTKAKSISSTAQQRGNSIFEKQTMDRVLEEILMKKFEMELREQRRQKENVPPASDRAGKASFTRRVPSFRYNTEASQWDQLDRKGRILPGKAGIEAAILEAQVDGKGRTLPGQSGIDNAILEAFQRVRPPLDLYEIHCEVKMHDGSYIRASPNYKRSGPWYDFAIVKWAGNPPLYYPARCVAFFENKSVSPPRMMAIVHGADVDQSDPQPKKNDTLLTSQYVMEYEGDFGNRRPKLYAIDIDSIESVVLCLPLIPKEGPFTLFLDEHRAGILALRPRNEWAYVWMAWTEILMKMNAPVTHMAISSKKSAARITNINPISSYVDLGDSDMIGNVRDNLKKIFEKSTKSLPATEDVQMSSEVVVEEDVHDNDDASGRWC